MRSSVVSAQTQSDIATVLACTLERMHGDYLVPGDLDWIFTFTNIISY